MTDIFKHVDVHIRCERCGAFTIPASVIANSQRLLEQGCPGSSYECPPELLATLIDPATLNSLACACRDVDSERIALCRWDDDGGKLVSLKRSTL